MNTLPSELTTIITSYIKDYYTLDTFQDAFRTQIDWITLIILNYPKFYKFNIKDHRSKYVYYDLIMSKNCHTQNYTPIYGEAAKYFLKNDLICKSNIMIPEIFKYDDCDIFNMFGIDIPFTRLIKLCFEYDAINILRQRLGCHDIRDLYNTLINILGNNYNTNISILNDTVKLFISRISFETLFTKEKLDLLKLLSLSTGPKDIFDYILNLLPKNISRNNIKDYKVAIPVTFKNCSISLYCFKKFYEKYPMIFDKKYKSFLKNCLESHLNQDQYSQVNYKVCNIEIYHFLINEVKNDLQ